MSRTIVSGCDPVNHSGRLIRAAVRGRWFEVAPDIERPTLIMCGTSRLGVLHQACLADLDRNCEFRWGLVPAPRSEADLRVVSSSGGGTIGLRRCMQSGE